MREQFRDNTGFGALIVQLVPVVGQNGTQQCCQQVWIVSSVSDKVALQFIWRIADDFALYCSLV
ncbi:hypothetical protein CKJ66_26970 [Mycobacterium avium]|uniref:Uncharacterized protein n=1 Tax=Mycobacterium avium TaxID=1764 RepID=A0A2A2ZB09_MYCAV|nr:hypothetical protein CKJ66_26970 [Mycobacterium avium]